MWMLVACGSKTEHAPPPPAAEPTSAPATPAAHTDRASPYERVEDPSIVVDNATARYKVVTEEAGPLVVEADGLDLQLDEADEDYRPEILDEEAAKYVNVLRREQRGIGFVMVRGDADPERLVWVETRRGRIRCNAPLTERSAVERTIAACWSAHRSPE